MALHPPKTTALRPTARWRWGLALTAGVVLVHGLLLTGWQTATGPVAAGDAPHAVQLRRIVQTVVMHNAPAPAAVPALPRPAAPQRPSKLATLPQPAVMSQPSAEPEPEAGGSAVPVYATRLPPPVTLRYALRRGPLQGHAELRWASDGERYELSLRNEAAGAQALGSASSGHIDAQGLAPERHTDSRRGRDVRAVNFQRDSERITFSGSRGELPLVAGAQDRLSWLLQLAGIVEANPGLRAVGSEITVYVVGTRGDAEPWLYSVVGAEALDLPAGAVPAALHLKRAPRRLYDTHVEVWLDPARQHLPVQVQMRVRATGEGSVWLLEGMGSP